MSIVFVAIAVVCLVLLGVVLRMTRQLRVANERIAHLIQLEELVTQRTAELEAASEAKTLFLSTVSHEIRTPMNAIVGFAHIFDKSNLNTSQKEHLEKIKLSAGALLAVINDVLDISKIESGKLELEKIPFNVNGLLDTVCSIVDFAAFEKDLQLNVHVTPDVPDALLGDPKRISQIILNLMNNAVKFTQQGGITLLVTLDEGNVEDLASEIPDEESNSIMLSIRVEDTGIGLTPEQAERLFQPFVQADNSVTRRFGGTGLGLAISRRLVELMGGTIGISSHLGKGSIFTFTLRLERCADSDDVTKAAHAPDAPLTPETTAEVLSLADKAVLVVEDNDINQEIAAVLLGEYGIIPDMADNGRIALDMVACKRYDGIFMDMQMPVMDGLEAARSLRALGAQAHVPDHDTTLAWLHTVPIIAMTANAMAEDRQRCLDAGMNDHIGKPIDPAVLRQRLLLWLTS